MKFRCVQPIEHDHQRYEPGSEIDLTEKQAEPLLAIGHIHGKKAKPADKPADGGGDGKGGDGTGGVS